MRLEHNEFCAEIDRRKKRIIKKKKDRNRLVVTCASLCLCLCLVAAVPWQRVFGGEPAAESGRLDGVSAIVTLPSGSSSEEVKTADGELVAELLCFIESNSSAFSRVVDDIKLDDLGLPEAETERIAEAVDEPNDDAENIGSAYREGVYAMSGENEDYVIICTQDDIKYGLYCGNVASDMYVITFENEDGERESFCFDPDENKDVAEQLQKLLSELY